VSDGVELRLALSPIKSLIWECVNGSFKMVMIWGRGHPRKWGGEGDSYALALQELAWNASAWSAEEGSLVGDRAVEDELRSPFEKAVAWIRLDGRQSDHFGSSGGIGEATGATIKGDRE
jgi:hypothetical protein